jgi:hypothetical protein
MAVALFDRIVKVELKKMTKSNYWDNKDYEKYKLPETPNEREKVLAKFEDADNGALYLPDARMSAFRVRTRERFLNWLKVFAFRYHYQLGEFSDYTANWLDKVQHDGSPIVEIFIQIIKGSSQAESKKDSNNVLTFHLHPTTFIITIQGNHHKYWSDHEFLYMRSMVDAACGIISGEDNQMEQELEFSDPNLSQFETVLDVSETDLKVTSSLQSNKSDKSKTIPTSEETKVDQNVISSIHVIEERVCQLSSTFDKHIECINEKLKQIDKFDTIIKSNTSDLDSRIKLLEEKLYKKNKRKLKRRHSGQVKRNRAKLQISKR